MTISRAHTTLGPDPDSIGGVAVRLGLDVVRTITTETAQRIVDARTDGPFTDLADLALRTELATDQLEALATAGALTAFGQSRRDTLWSAGAAARDRTHLLPGTSMTSTPPHAARHNHVAAHSRGPVGHPHHPPTATPSS